jgi:hypothetical protein
MVLVSEIQKCLDMDIKENLVKQLILLFEEKPEEFTAVLKKVLLPKSFVENFQKKNNKTVKDYFLNLMDNKGEQAEVDRKMFAICLLLMGNEREDEKYLLYPVMHLFREKIEQLDSLVAEVAELHEAIKKDKRKEKIQKIREKNFNRFEEVYKALA